jgi:two-component system nitrogen regulation response regulator GlnG
MKPVWVIDDDSSIRWVLEKALTRAAIPVRSFAAACDALHALEEDTPSVVVTDVRMPGQDGLSLLQRVKQARPHLAVIVMTAFSDLDSTVQAFQKGAFDYLPKPFDVEDAVDLIKRAIESDIAATPGPEDRVDTPLMQSSSPAMQDVFRAIGRLARSTMTVLITGESGTGKELIARALHAHSARASGPFVALNAAAIPKDLLEAELFGHERGAFTGATQMRVGRFEQARGGTLFLDEIGDMPLELQTRLLRVLAEGAFYRVGGSHAIQADVRIVTATHQPLEQRVEQGRFREDLFHRLNVIRLRLPPLRERKDDIPGLVELFLRTSATQLGVPARRVSPDAMRALVNFHYPGNIRQLENFCQWLTVMSASQRIQLKDLPPELRAPEALPAIGESANAAAALGAPTWLTLLRDEAQLRLERREPAFMATLTRDFERVLLKAALDFSGGRRAEAAQRLGLGRNTLTRKYSELGLDDDT